MQPEELLLFAADAARLMLESGGETYRAEETAMDIVASFGGAEAECFATSTGLMLSFMGEDGKVHSIVRRMKRGAMNLEKVSRIDSMVRDLRMDKIGFPEAAREMDEVERMRDRPYGVRMAASAAGAAFFTLLFGGVVKDAVAAAFVGAAIALLILGFQKFRLPDFLASLAGGAIAALASLTLQKCGLLVHVDITIIGIIMLLVPGVAITNAIRDLIAGDLVAGIARGADAFLTAAAISAGAGGAFAFWKLLQMGLPL
jgi:uncharacterized membrane protein YjjP (DUF1212 family)